MAILEAIVAGQRDPSQLATQCHAKVHADRPTVIKSLTGNYRPEHLFTLKQSLAAYRNYQSLLAECDQEIQGLTGSISGKISTRGPAPHPRPQKRRKNQFHFDMRSELHRLFGVDLTAVPGINALTAHALLSEVGPDLSRFPSAAAFRQLARPVPRQRKERRQNLLFKNPPHQQPTQPRSQSCRPDSGPQPLSSGQLLSIHARTTRSPAGHHCHGS